MIQSIIVYSFLLAFMLLFAKITSQTSNTYLTPQGYRTKSSFWTLDTILPLLMFSVIFGMRFDVGKDYISYLNSYLYDFRTEKFEFLYKLILDVSNDLRLHFSIYFGILAFIQVFFFFYAFKKEKFLYVYLMLFLFTNGDVFFWMNGIRQALAMCIWIYSIKYIEEKKFKNYLFWGIIAFMFHRSAIFLIIFYPLLKNGRDYFKSISFQILLITLAFIVKNAFFDLILKINFLIEFYTSIIGEELYRSYDMDTLLESFSDKEGSGLVFMVEIGINFLIILFSTRLKNFYNSKRFIILYFFYITGLFTFYLFPVGAISFTRPFRYFYIFQTIILAYFLYYLIKSKNIYNRILYIFLIIFYLSIFYLGQIVSSEENHLWYQFFFQQSYY